MSVATVCGEPTVRRATVQRSFPSTPVSVPRHDYEPAPQSHQPRPTSRIPDYYKFNPYNLLPYGWLRRLLKASHPHARADYYVYALRHILR